MINSVDYHVKHEVCLLHHSVCDISACSLTGSYNPHNLSSLQTKVSMENQESILCGLLAGHLQTWQQDHFVVSWATDVLSTCISVATPSSLQLSLQHAQVPTKNGLWLLKSNTASFS